MFHADAPAQAPRALRIQSIFRTSAIGTVAQHFGAMRHPLALAGVLSHAMAFALVWQAFVAPVAFGELAGLFLLILVTCMAVTVGCVALLLRLSRRANLVTLHLTPPIVLAVGLSLWIGGLYTQTFGSSSLVDTGLLFGVLWIGSEALLALFVAVCLPHTLEAHNTQAAEEQPAPQGDRFALSELVMMRSDGRQVILTTLRDSARVSGPLSALVENLPEGSGTMIHRSLWVASHAVLGHHRQGRRLMVDLIGGHQVEVALSRQSTVLSWLRALAAQDDDWVSLRTDRPVRQPSARQNPDVATP